MSLRARLNLRHNWPLWVAILLSVLALLYCLFTISKPLRYPFAESVIYPFMLIVPATAIYLFGLSLLFLLITGLWALVAINEEHVTKIVVAPIVLAIIILVTRASGALIIFLFLAALMLTIVASFRRAPKRSVALILSVVAVVGFFFPALDRLFQSIDHRDAIGFNNAVYQVAQIQGGDWDCEQYIFVVYQCDSLGLVCQPRFTSDVYQTSCYGYPPAPLPTLVSLTVDPATDQLTLQLDDERFPIEP